MLYIDDGVLICHRVTKHYEQDGKQYVVARGDANDVSDPKNTFDQVRGKVIKNTKKIGKIALFFKSAYFFFALCGSLFFILLGVLISSIKKDNSDNKKNGK